MAGKGHLQIANLLSFRQVAKLLFQKGAFFIHLNYESLFFPSAGHRFMNFHFQSSIFHFYTELAEVNYFH